MIATFEFAVESRTDEGKGASRRLRRAGKVPGVIYGAGKEPQSIMLSHSELLQRIEQEAFFSHILELTVDGKKTKAVVKDMQRHPFKPVVMHIDFQRVGDKDKIKMHVPVHFLNEESAPGVREGGTVSHSLTSIDVLCLAKDLPEFIEVDMSGMNIGDSVHLSQLKLPKGVEIPELKLGEEHDQSVVSILGKGGSIDAAAEGDEEGEAEGETEE